MRPVAFALTVVLAAPLAAAQSEAPDIPAAALPTAELPTASVPTTEVPTSPAVAPREIRLTPLEVHPARPSPETHRTLRITLSTLLVPVGGTLGGFFSLLIGAGIGSSIPNDRGTWSGFDNTIRGGLIGGGIGLVLATPATAALIGHFTGGRGHYGWTLLGTVGGGGFGVFLAVLMSRSMDEQAPAFVVPYVFTTAGTILAYEMS
jgi:hypothetical protein